MKKEDINLIQDIQNGNKKSETILYKKYKKKIENFIRVKYPKNSETDDDVSEIMIKIFETISSFDKNKASFGTWAIKIAQNYMIDKARKNENNPISANLDSINGSISYYTTTNSDLYVNASNTSTLTSSFFCQSNNDLENKDSLCFISNKIGLKDFHLLNMKYSEGYDYNEMEKEMGMSSSTISNRINYIKGKLKRGL